MGISYWNEKEQVTFWDFFQDVFASFTAKYGGDENARLLL